jgi:hypothetical protein
LVKTFNRSPYTETHSYFTSKFWLKKGFLQKKKSINWLKIFWRKKHFLQYTVLPFININFVKYKNWKLWTKIHTQIKPFPKKPHNRLIFCNPLGFQKFLFKKNNIPQINFKPVFHKQFIRNTYFFLYFFKNSVSWAQHFQIKVKHFKLEYTFVNTTHLKKYVIRRFSREMFFSKFGLTLGLNITNQHFSYKNSTQPNRKVFISNSYPNFLWFDNQQTNIQTIPESKKVPLKYISRIRHHVVF